MRPATGFYLPSRLPPSYNKWISTLARMDPRLLQLLRDARSGAYTYGQEPSAEVAKMTAGIASALGISSSYASSLSFHLSTDAQLTALSTRTTSHG
jgi:hypothetical protein